MSLHPDVADRKKDEGKLRFDLIPPYALEQVADVFTKGVSQYGDRHYLTGTSPERLVAAIHRHLNQHQQGEYLDQETGNAHMAHIVSNAMMILDIKHQQSQECTA